MSPRVTVVGLGPGGPDLVTTGTRDALDEPRPRFLRTRRHPAASLLADAVSFDDVYDTAARIDDVYAGIVERLVDAARRHGDVLYAVPGSPAVAERTVELLRTDERVTVEVLAALSFVDLAWVRLGVDPLAEGVRIVDGHRFAVDAAGERGPMLVCQCDSAEVLAGIELAVEEPPADPVVVLQRLGSADERITAVRWDELAGSVDADHLTSVYLPRLGAPVAAELARFDALVTTLREQCPWDREQTHQSLARYLLEESYEVLEAIDRLRPEDPASIDALEEELGDLLFQVVFHATIARQEGWFDLADVSRGIHDKLRARHPHVFGGVEVSGPDDVAANWEVIKAAEKGRSSVLEGIPHALPALALAAKLLRKAAAVGVEVTPVGDGVADRLLAEVVEARAAGVDPEDALRRRLVALADQIRAAESG